MNAIERAYAAWRRADAVHAAIARRSDRVGGLLLLAAVDFAAECERAARRCRDIAIEADEEGLITEAAGRASDAEHHAAIASDLAREARRVVWVRRES